MKTIEEMFNEQEVGKLNEVDGIDCPLCKNRGYFYIHNEDGAPFVKECECMQKRRAKKYAELSGLGSLLKYKATDYKPATQQQADMLKCVKNYVRMIDSNSWLALLGQSGSGKTMLCSAVCNFLIENQERVLYVKWNDVTNQIKKNLNEFDKVLDEYKHVDTLYIDDFLKGSRSDYDVNNIAYDLIDYRYNNNLRTIISSELTIDDLEEISSAVAGRIIQKCNGFFYQIKGKENNYRIHGKN